MRSILAFDLAGHVGWAGQTRTGLIQSGHVMLVRKKDSRGDRFARFQELMGQLFPVMQPELVAYEEVMAHSSMAASHIFGGFRSMLEGYCALHGRIPCKGIGVKTIKKFATGRGDATKDLMVMAARAKWPDQDVTDDNHADALWVMETAIHLL